jgi:elongation factor P hydroxylase
VKDLAEFAMFGMKRNHLSVFKYWFCILGRRRHRDGFMDRVLRVADVQANEKIAAY